MPLRDLISKMSGVMVYHLYLLDNDGCYVDEDTVDYINQERVDCDLKLDTYGNWYVVEIGAISVTGTDVVICPIDREED